MSEVTEERLHELLHRCKQRSGLSYQELDSLAAICDELTTLRRSHAELVRDAWQPIETAPKGPILGLCPDVGIQKLSAGWDNATPEKIRWEAIGGYVVHPTHWRPLPALPKDSP